MAKIIFHGHAFLEIEDNNKSILIDPFISGNSLCDTTVDHIKHLNVVAIILTHGHGDHIGDTVAIAKKTGALVIGEFQLMKYLEEKESLKNTHGMSIGGAFDFGWFQVKLSQAFHGWGIGDKKPYAYNTIASSVLLRYQGKTIFHAGDTGLTKEFELLGLYDHIDYAFLPIGDNFTMGPRDASIAAQMMKAKMMIPIHYNTREIIKQDPQILNQLLENTEINVNILQAGEYVEF